VIVRENIISVNDISYENVLEFGGSKSIFRDALFFDLEHYVYKKPVCIGVFGCCYYDEAARTLLVTQYMIENKKELKELLLMAEDYFNSAFKEKEKKHIVTFSGNNDFTIIDYLFRKYSIKLDFDSYFKKIDIQKIYENYTGESIGLKNLEKLFNIERKNEPISGSNLAKTFSKIIKDDDYIKRMPLEKVNKILLYNEQDVINLFKIFVNWNTYVKPVKKTI
jgi:uncharacterized protein YprB with RNaseH-like and TPR domain